MIVNDVNWNEVTFVHFFFSPLALKRLGLGVWRSVLGDFYEQPLRWAYDGLGRVRVWWVKYT